MEIWWWLEPLFNTSIAILIIGAVIAWIVYQLFENEGVAAIVALISVMPLVICALLLLINLLIAVFVDIWKPYI